MAVTPRAANVGTVTHPVTLPTRPLAVGQARAAQLVLAAVIAAGLGLRLRRVALGPRSPRSPRRARLDRRLRRPARSRRVPARAGRPARPSRPGCRARHGARRRGGCGAGRGRRSAAARRRPLIGFLAVAGWDVRRHRTRTADRPLRVLGLGAGEEAARLARTPSTTREAYGVELVGFVGNHSHAVVPVLGELERAARDPAPPRHRRDRPDRQPPPPAAARSPARRRRPYAGAARADRSLRARLRLRPGGGDQRGLVHRVADAAPPAAGLARAPQLRHRRGSPWPPC